MDMKRLSSEDYARGRALGQAAFEANMLRVPTMDPALGRAPSLATTLGWLAGWDAASETYWAVALSDIPF
jgi:hypothetical protein